MIRITKITLWFICVLIESITFAAIYTPRHLGFSQALTVVIAIVGIITAFPLAYLCTDDFSNDWGDLSFFLGNSSYHKEKHSKEKDEYIEKANSIFYDLITANDEAQFQKAFENMIKFAKEPGKYNKCIYGDTLIKLRDFAPEVEQKVLEGLRNLKKD